MLVKIVHLMELFLENSPMHANLDAHHILFSGAYLHISVFRMVALNSAS